jgi:hypothetical protein
MGSNIAGQRDTMASCEEFLTCTWFLASHFFELACGLTRALTFCSTSC